MISCGVQVGNTQSHVHYRYSMCASDLVDVFMYVQTTHGGDEKLLQRLADARDCQIANLRTLVEKQRCVIQEYKTSSVSTNNMAVVVALAGTAGFFSAILMLLLVFV